MEIHKERYNTGIYSIVRSLFKRLLFERNAPQTPFSQGEMCYNKGNVCAKERGLEYV